MEGGASQGLRVGSEQLGYVGEGLRRKGGEGLRRKGWEGQLRRVSKKTRRC